MLFSFISDYVIIRDKTNQDGLKLNGAHQFLVYDNDDILSGNLYTIKKKNTEALVVGSKETGIEVNTDKTNHMVMFQDQNSRQSHNIEI